MSTGDALNVMPQLSTAARKESIWRAVLRSNAGRAGLILGALMLGVIIFGSFAAPYDPNAIGVGPPASPPTAAHLFGTDDLGRDVLSRFLCGGMSILVIPLLAVATSYLVGGTLGLLAGYKRGRCDAIINSSLDLFLAFPPFLLILIMIAGFGSSQGVLVAAVAIVFVPRVGRLVRAATLGVAASDFVAAAEARGERTSHIIVREVFPNITEQVVVDVSLRLTSAIVYVSSLNFLGLGIQPPNPDWGVMVADGRGILALNAMAVLAPAAGIALLSVSFNLVADTMGSYLTRPSS